MMKKTVLYISCLMLFAACSNNRHAGRPSFTGSNKADSSSIAIISLNSARIYIETDTSWFTPFAKPTGLTETDMIELDTILYTCINTNYKFTDTKTDSHKWLSKYKRQYVPFVNERGEKLVWVNCFCPFSFFNNWKSEIVSHHMIMDGGECFFNVTINLTTKSFNRLQKMNNGNG